MIQKNLLRWLHVANGPVLKLAEAFLWKELLYGILLADVLVNINDVILVLLALRNEICLKAIIVKNDSAREVHAFEHIFVRYHVLLFMESQRKIILTLEEFQLVMVYHLLVNYVDWYIYVGGPFTTCGIGCRCCIWLLHPFYCRECFDVFKSVIQIVETFTVFVPFVKQEIVVL